MALHFDGDGLGGDIVVFTAEAAIVSDMPPAYEVPQYAAKYQDGFKRINITPEAFAKAYPVPLRVTPTHLRGH